MSCEANFQNAEN